MRGMIADKMMSSLNNAAQLTYHTECLADTLLERRAVLKSEGSVVSIEDLLIKTISDALHQMPIFNSIVNDKNVTISKNHNISVAVSLPNGLVAPTIFDVQNKTLEEISSSRKDLISRARSGKLTVPEMTGGTFTISNLGLRHIHYFTPIINAPQVAILGIGQMIKKTWVGQDDEVSIKHVMGLSLTTDHRVIDGDPSGKFLGLLCDIIENA